MHPSIAFMVLTAALATQATPPTAVALVARYVEALGGETALRAVRSRTTEGQFDNGRGLKTRFRSYERSPNQRVTLIGTDPIEAERGSGRGYDGAVGWDKNFIGTGLRTLEGRELMAFIREADMLRPLHLLDQCGVTAVEADASHDIVVCDAKDSGRLRFHFDRQTGLLVEQEAVGANSQPPITSHFDDYRLVDGVRMPYRTRIVVPESTVVFTVASIRHNETIDSRVFARPASD